MTISIPFLLAWIGLLASNVEGGNYLFYLPFSSRSIKLGFMPMARELARRGHNVTMVCPHKDKKSIPGITEIIHSSPFDEISSQVSDNVLLEQGSATDLPVSAMIEATITANREALASPEMQQILTDPSIQFDVVMTIPAFGNEAGNFVAEAKNASLVWFLSIPILMPWVASAVGSPSNPAYMPCPMVPYGMAMSFKERLVNTIASAALALGRTYYVLPKVSAMLLEVLPWLTEAPDLDYLSKKTALVIYHGSPFTGDGLRPLAPNIIQAGLMSCFPGGALEGELREWVEGAEHGVIYLSFGSVVKASKMPESRRLLLLNVLTRLKQRVIWKWEKEMTDLPANVKTFAWLPQTDVLSHPNVKLFVTHGGAGSIQETICHKTPIVGIPLMGDQVNNLAEAETQHLGIIIQWSQVTEENLLSGINQVLSDNSYQDSVDRLQSLIMDAPLHPRDKAVWWLEYILRHPHNPGMRSPAKDLNLAQYFLLDVFGCLLAALVIVFYVIKKVAGLFCKQKIKRKAE